MRKKKASENQTFMIQGQMSVWDFLAMKAPILNLKVESLIVNENSSTLQKVELHTKVKEVSLKQQKVIDKYKQAPNLNRIIHYCGGGIGIEFSEGESFNYIYVNNQGQEEFTSSKKASVIYLDEVIWDKQNNLENKIDVMSIKVGDYVEAFHGKDVITGEIISEYGLNNWILNIVFDNGKRCTAIGRQAVRKILRS